MGLCKSAVNRAFHIIQHSTNQLLLHCGASHPLLKWQFRQLKVCNIAKTVLRTEWQEMHMHGAWLQINMHIQTH